MVTEKLGYGEIRAIGEGTLLMKASHKREQGLVEALDSKVSERVR